MISILFLLDLFKVHELLQIIANQVLCINCIPLSPIQLYFGVEFQFFALVINSSTSFCETTANSSEKKQEI
jgi:hypothetical protein